MIFILFVLAGVSPLFTSSVSVRRPTDYCSHDDFTCMDGGCVRFDKICDGIRDCLDGSDEAICSGVSYDDSWMNNRVKRQSTCLKTQWQCRDGTCIGFDGKCDGIVDCPDGSDETHPLCRKTQCQSNWFRCTYGACVDGTAPCNGIQECADNSDELLPRCRNETDEVRGQFKCQNGQTIPASQLCDGAVDCSDGSDETIRACAARRCPSYVFQCAYGACVDQGSDCDGKQDCADNSDESDELCNRISSVTTKPVVTQSPLPQGGKCVLPQYPKHGAYVVVGSPNAKPGQTYLSVFINVTCNPGFGVENHRDSLYCFDGIWSEEMPKCVRFCRLYTNPSVEYRCLISGVNGVEGSRECGSLEAAGTVVRPECRAPNYYSGTLPFMHCIDGNWDYIAVCKPGGNITIKINDSIVIYVTNYDKNTNIEINAGKQNVSIEGNGLNVSIINVGNATDINSVENNSKSNSSGMFPYNPNGNVTNDDTGNGNASTNQYNSIYDIDEGDWRIGQAVVTRPNYLNYRTDNSIHKHTDNPVIYFKN